MKWFSRVCLLLTLPLCGLLLDSMFNYNSFDVRLGRHQLGVASAWYEVSIYWFDDAQKVNGLMQPFLWSRTSNAAMRGWYWHKRFTLDAGTDPRLGWSCGLSFPYWFAILLLLVPSATRELWRWYRRENRRQGFQVEAVGGAPQGG